MRSGFLPCQTTLKVSHRAAHFLQGGRTMPSVEVSSVSGQHLGTFDLDYIRQPLEIMPVLMANSGVPRQYQRLLFEGKILSMTKTFEDQGLSEGGLLVLVAVAPSEKELRMTAIAHDDSCFARYLLKARADPRTTDESGLFPLLHAAKWGFRECIAALLEADANPLQINKFGRSALWVACRGGHEACVQLLLQARAGVEQADQFAVTPLHAAAQSGQEACLRLLLEAQAQINRCNHDGESALLMAAQAGHENCVELLLSRGADHSKAGCLGKTPLVAASQRNREVCVTLLKAAAAEPGLEHVE